MTRKDFNENHREALCGVVTTPEGKETVRNWILDAVTEGHFNCLMYRAEPGRYDIEDLILKRLELFRNEGGYDQAQHHLKMIRRFLLKRYAFGVVRKVDERLKGRLWLWKDYVVPRIGLAMVLGFGAVLGAGPVSDWLGNRGMLYGAVVLSACLVLVLCVVYLNVRGILGGPSRRVRRRTWGVFGISVGWASGPALVASVVQPTLFVKWLLVSFAALLFALLSQFFFGQAGTSMGEPL